MKIPKSIVLAAIGAFAGVTFAAGITVVAGAVSNNTQVTYYGCVSLAGKLSHVGTTAPSCPSQSTRISWNKVGPQGPPGPEAESTYADFVPTERGDMASVTLSFASGTYAVTWTVFNATGSCSYSASTNVTMTTPFDGSEVSALISVGTGGGSLTLDCEGNAETGTAGSLMTAVPTTMQ